MKTSTCKQTNSGQFDESLEIVGEPLTFICKSNLGGSGGFWITIHNGKKRVSHFTVIIFVFSYFTEKNTIVWINSRILRFGGIDIFCEQIWAKRSTFLF